MKKNTKLDIIKEVMQDLLGINCGVAINRLIIVCLSDRGTNYNQLFNWDFTAEEYYEMWDELKAVRDLLIPVILENCKHECDVAPFLAGVTRTTFNTHSYRILESLRNQLR